MPLTPRQELHLQVIINKAQELLDKKFRDGAAEHPGDLQDMSLMDLLQNALMENIDQFTYLLTAIQKENIKLVVGGVHTPNRILGHGEHAIECRVCWHCYGEHTCRQSRKELKPKESNNGIVHCPQCKHPQVDCSCSKASATA